MFRPRVPCRRGFTLSQLLVLLALLLILLGVFLPALLKAGLAARRIQDSNNLKQICLATINAADTYQGKLAPLVGHYPSTDATTPNNGHGSMFFCILPFIEQANLYNSSLVADPIPGYQSEVVWGTVIKTYVSPNDPGDAKDLIHDGWLAKSNYAANFLVFGDPRTDSLAGQARFPASIPDGTSNTIFFAQRYRLCGSDPCAWGYDGGTAWAPAFAYLSKGKFQTRPAADRCDSALAQGLFPEGINVGLGDGSVRLVAATLSPETWWLACDPADGNPLGIDW